VLRKWLSLGVAAVSVVALAACTSDEPAEPDAAASATSVPSSTASLDPADFTADITNPYWPMPVGARWVYAETEGRDSQKVVVTVTDRTKTVAAGVEARVVHDVVTEDGDVVEDTFDWYAQDADGNIWYLGEDTAEYEDGEVVTREGSWEAGVDGAEAGVLIPADPQPGMAYRQEYLAGEAEDEAAVLSVSEMVEAPTGRYTGALLTRETTPLEPKVAELKFYAPGIGPVLVLQVSGGTSREELVSYTGVG
jgi:hypothetical protein